MIKKCKNCGKEFTVTRSLRNYCCEKCKLLARPKSVCIVCGKEFIGNKKTCSNECLHIQHSKNNAFRRSDIKEKIANTNMDRYGVKNPMQSKIIQDKVKNTAFKKYGRNCNVDVDKSKITMLNKYGVEHALQSDVFKKKVKETIARTGKSGHFHSPEWNQAMLKKYGTTTPYKNDDIKNKGINTLIERYGVKSPMKLDWVKDKSKQTCLSRYGVEYSFQSDVSKEKRKKTCLAKYGVENVGILNTYGRISKLNKKIGELLDIKESDYEFPLISKAYDLKKENTLIEINPTVTHNSDTDVIFGKKPKDPNYHYDKRNLAVNNGYDFMAIWDWDDLNKIQNYFKPKTTIYARSCDVALIDKESSDKFLDNYHFQNHCAGDRIRIGLIYNNILVAIMTFGDARYTTGIELLRLCFHPNYTIIGGSEKLFKFFISNYNPDKIVSYCDKSKFNGNVYKKLGFNLSRCGLPSIHWYNNKTEQHITDNLLRQRGFDQLFHKNYGKGVDNNKLMLENGFVRVYDCGQDTYEWFKKKDI